MGHGVHRERAPGYLRGDGGQPDRGSIRFNASERKEQKSPAGEGRITLDRAAEHNAGPGWRKTSQTTLIHLAFIPTAV
jgi:hypothetical protein